MTVKLPPQDNRRFAAAYLMFLIHTAEQLPAPSLGAPLRAVLAARRRTLVGLLQRVWGTDTDMWAYLGNSRHPESNLSPTSAEAAI